MVFDGVRQRTLTEQHSQGTLRMSHREATPVNKSDFLYIGLVRWRLACIWPEFGGTFGSGTTMKFCTTLYLGQIHRRDIFLF